MGYDIQLGVKVDGTEIFVKVAEPEQSYVTYNLSEMLKKAMDWDFEDYHWYKCTKALPKIERGIRELHINSHLYTRYEPDNGWGSIYSAREALESLRDIIFETACCYVPIEHLWVRW
jgi:hypothetical protein